MTTVVGAFCIVWAETRYLPLVLEQMARMDGPTLVLHCDYPMYWTDRSVPESGHASGVTDILNEFSKIPVVKLVSHVENESDLRNMARSKLVDLGAEEVMLLDSDWIFDVKEFDALIKDMSTNPADRLWGVPAFHFWRNWNTTYADTSIRFAAPAKLEWSDGGFGHELENNPYIGKATCYHPSYVLSRDEMHRKVHSFWHAPLFVELNFWEKWCDGTADNDQKLRQFQTGLPIDVSTRLMKWGCLDGIND